MKPALGRKTKRTPEVQAKLIEALKDGCTYAAACGFAGISRSEFYEWKSECADFMDAITRAEDQAEAGYTRVIAECARNGDWKAAESWLKRRRRDAWSERQEVTGADGKDIPTAVMFVPHGISTDTNNS